MSPRHTISLIPCWSMSARTASVASRLACRSAISAKGGWGMPGSDSLKKLRACEGELALLPGAGRRALRGLRAPLDLGGGVVRRGLLEGGLDLGLDAHEVA